MTDRSTTLPEDVAARSERRPYTPPEVVVWGDILHLTKGGAGAQVDDSFAPSKPG